MNIIICQLYHNKAKIKAKIKKKISEHYEIPPFVENGL